MSGDLLTRLAEAGTPLALVMEVAEALADARSAERILAKRRKEDRERKAVTNPRIPRNSTEAEENADSADRPLDKEKVPRPLKEINPREIDNLPACEALDLPEGISGELWVQYRAMRRKIRKPLTANAERLALKHLRKFAEDGHPPGEIVEAAIVGSYQGLFAPKAPRNGHARQHEWGSTVAAADELIADIRAARERGEAPPPASH